MKSYNFSLLLFMLISVKVICTQKVTRVVFSKIVEDLVKGDKQNYSIVEKAARESEIDLEQKNVAAKHREILSALKEASEIRKELSQNIYNTCTGNRAAYNHIKDLPKLNESTKDFIETSKWVLEEEVQSLKTVTQQTLGNGKKAEGYLDQIINKLNGLRGALLHLKDGLRELGSAKLERVRPKIRHVDVVDCGFFGTPPPGGCESLREKYRNSLEKVEKVNKFIKSSNNYTAWIERSVGNLKSLVKDDEAVIVNLIGKAMASKAFHEKVENVISDKLEKQPKQRIIYYSTKVSSEVRDLSNLCSNLLH